VLLLSRRQAAASHALALLETGATDEAVTRARQAVALPAEDVRSAVLAQVALARTLAAAGRCADATDAARQASDLAHGTEQTAERPLADALLAELTALPTSPAPGDVAGQAAGLTGAGIPE
jgi:hypothetical protein